MYYITFEEFRKIKFEAEFPEIFYEILYFIGRFKSNDKARFTDYYYNINRQIHDEILVKDPAILQERELKSWIYDHEKIREKIESLITDTKAKEKKNLLIIDIL